MAVKNKQNPAINENSLNDTGSEQDSESERKSTFTYKTAKSKSGAVAKHCPFENCKSKLVSGPNWSRHLRDIHNSDKSKAPTNCKGDECS